MVHMHVVVGSIPAVIARMVVAVRKRKPSEYLRLKDYSNNPPALAEEITRQGLFIQYQLTYEYGIMVIRDSTSVPLR